MPEQLTQGQIDALLKRINSGEDLNASEADDNKKIREYDFKSPKKFTKEQLKAMDSLHENFSRLLSSYLSGLLRLYSEVTVVQIEEQRYFEYSNALPDSALIGLLDIKPADVNTDSATLIMDMSTTLGFSMIDRLLGGTGEGYNFNREFTDIELAILENVLGRIATLLQEAWCNYIEVSTHLSSIETNARLMQALAPEDIVVIVVLNVKIRNLNGNLSICIPAVDLEDMISHFSNKFVRNSKRTNVELEHIQKRLIWDHLNDSDLEIKAVLDEFQLDLRDVLQLQVEDVIPLNKGIDKDIYITVDNTPWYSAKLGETRTKKAVKLNKMINSGVK